MTLKEKRNEVYLLVKENLGPDVSSKKWGDIQKQIKKLLSEYGDLWLKEFGVKTIVKEKIIYKERKPKPQPKGYWD